MNPIHRMKGPLIIGFSAIAFLGVGMGVHYALRSDLFTVGAVEIQTSLENPPLSTQALLKIAAVPTGTVSLFRLDLKAIEKRLLGNEWIHQVRLQMKPRNTLGIFISFKEPKALYQSKRGTLSFVDIDGKTFGTVNVMSVPDLPILGGFSDQSPAHIQEALRLIEGWEHSPLKSFSFLASVYWQDERGFRGLVTYSLGSHAFARTMVEFGPEMLANLESRLKDLYPVFHYLGDKSIAARQVWADAGKKIVVKTVHGS